MLHSKSRLFAAFRRRLPPQKMGAASMYVKMTTVIFGLYGVQMLASSAASHVDFGRERAS